MTARRLHAWWMPEPWAVLVFRDTRAIAEHLAAELIVRAGRGALRKVALASGASFAPFFRTLRERVEAGAANFDGVLFHHLDEFEGVTPAVPGSLAREIATTLFPDADPRRGAFHPIDTTASNPAEAHERALSDCDLALLGIGRNGHLAFNEPGTPLSSRTHVTTLHDATRAAHAEAFDGRPVPERALTAGVQTILGAREIVFVATGATKAAAVLRALCGPIGPACPASAIRLHDRVTILLDEAAAGELEASLPVGATPSLELRARTGSATSPATLVLAPHPDDASISCGGLLASMPRDVPRVIVTFSTGARAIPGLPPDGARDLRERESAEEARILGAAVRFLRAAGYDSASFEPADSDALLALLEELSPTRVLLPARGDPHPTHRLCRLVAEDAINRWRALSRSPLEVWTYEGPWFLLDQDAINVLQRIDPVAHGQKQRGVLAHASQIARVPFHDGAAALERLRALAFSESHLGGRTDGGFDHGARIECYQRIVLG
jgi:glucosamine-6-phosphate deaminase